MDLDADAWTSWDPTFGEVSAWTPRAGEALTDRIRIAAARSWTAVLEIDGVPLEFAHTQTHDRVRLIFDGELAWEAHFEPGDGRALGMRDTSLVFCNPARDDSPAECVRIDGTEELDEVPHLFDTFTDSFLYFAADVIDAQTPPALVPPLDAPADVWSRMGTTTLSSPIGRLDCIVGLPEDRTAEEVEGQPVSLLAASTQSGERALSCVDVRGLVVLSPGLVGNLRPFTGLDSGVEDGIEVLPAEPTPYGEAESPTRG